jgi:hypothetical protein
MFGHGQLYPTHKLSQQKMKKKSHVFQKAFEVSCHMTWMTQHPPVHHPKTLILGFVGMGQNPTPRPYWVFFVMSPYPLWLILPPSYVPNPSYLPPFPLTFPFFHPKHHVAPMASPLQYCHHICSFSFLCFVTSSKKLCC